MKNLIFIAAILTLSGCSIFKQPVPIKVEFPTATPELLKKCKNLETIEGDKVPITELLKIIVNNYTLYYECSNKVDGWQEWYNENKKIYDSLK